MPLLNDLDRPNGITCPRFVLLPGSEKTVCQHYAGKGACSLPDEFMCSEWAKRNPKQAEGYRAPCSQEEVKADPLALDDDQPEQKDDPLSLDDDPLAQSSLPIGATSGTHDAQRAAPPGAIGAKRAAAPMSPKRSTREVERQAQR